MEKFQSINPYNGELIKEFEPLSRPEAIKKVELAQREFETWRKSTLGERIRLLEQVAILLEERKEVLATAMTQEMGKPIVQAIAEIEKCAWVCRYYAENAEMFLTITPIETDASKSYISYQPLGVLLAIMPWNFPFWQLFRFAAPSLTSGNVVLLKHSPNTLMSALFIEALFRDAGYPTHVFQNIIIPIDEIPEIVSHSAIQGVTLTGSARAGSAVAQEAGKHIKKTVLELGGSNPFIVLPDADIDLAVEAGFMGRMLNTGQSCIAAKRFILHEAIHDEYVEKLVGRCSGKRVSDPMKRDTFFGPLARIDLADELSRQVRDSVSAGAEIQCGLTQNKAHFQPGVLTNVKPGMPAFDEETFGPVAAITKVNSVGEALELANKSAYGLGATVCTSSVSKHKWMARDLQGGSVFFNDFVKSDPRLPFGGTGRSGYGRELGMQGILEFINTKTIYVK